NVAHALPYVHDYVVGNEPNLNRYWLPQFGLDGSDLAAPAYESLLAKTYDALKAVSPKIIVLGGAVSPRGIDRPNTGRDTHSPTACQPNVLGLFLFHSVDETDLDRWQSGLYYADGTPKASLAPTRTAVLAAKRGIVARCAGLRLPVKAKLDRASARNPRFSFRLSCDIDCTYRARLERLPQHSTVMVSRGVAVGGKPLRVAFAPRKLAPGRYRFTVRVT